MTVFVDLIFTVRVQPDIVTTRSKASGKSKAIKGANSVTVVTSAANGNKLTNNIYKSENAAAINSNLGVTNESK